VDDLKRAVVHGNILGSFACAGFGIDGTRLLSKQDIIQRYRELVEYSHFDSEKRA